MADGKILTSYTRQNSKIPDTVSCLSDVHILHS